MAGPEKSNAYGGKATDSDFRRTWDREEYAARARERDEKIREEGKARHEAAAAGKKYHRRASTPPDAKDTEARKARLNVASRVGKTELVGAASAVGKKGQGPGFYCKDCDLTFKDNLQWVEHLNSKQHLVNTGQTGEVKRATVEQVRDRLAWLKRKFEEEKKEENVDLQSRLEMSREQEEKEREEKRRKRNEKRRKTKDGMGVKQEDDWDGVIR